MCIVQIETIAIFNQYSNQYSIPKTIAVIWNETMTLKNIDTNLLLKNISELTPQKYTVK